MIKNKIDKLKEYYRSLTSKSLEFSNEYEKARSFYAKGEIKTCLEILKTVPESEVFFARILELIIIIEQGNYNKSENLLKEMIHLNKTNFQSFYLKSVQAFLFLKLNKFDDAITTANEGLIIYEKFDSETKQKITVNENLADLYRILGLANDYEYRFGVILNQERLSISLNYHKKSLKLFNEIPDLLGMSRALHNIGNVLLITDGVSLKESEDNFERSLAIRMELGNKRELASSFIILSNVYFTKNEFSKALDFMNQGLQLKIELNNHDDISIAYIDHALLLFQMQDKTAIDFALKGYFLSSELKNKFYLNFALVTTTLIMAEIEDGRFNEFFEKLKINIKLDYLIDYIKAIKLKKEKRISSQGQAQELFKNLVSNMSISRLFNERLNLKTNSVIYLTELLLVELQSAQQEQVPIILDEIKTWIDKLKSPEISTGYNKASVKIKGLIIESKINLFELNASKAKRKLNEARKLANFHGMDALSLTISNEYDEVQAQIEKWNQISGSNLSVIDRLKESQLDTVLTVSNKNYQDSLEKAEQDDPYLFMIINKSGLSIFSKIFTNEQSLNDQLISGFISAINSFSKETFGERDLESINYKGITLLIEPWEDLLFVYAFKGKSTYFPLKKLDYFLENISEIYSFEFLASTPNDLNGEQKISDLAIKTFQDFDIVINEE